MAPAPVDRGAAAAADDVRAAAVERGADQFAGTVRGGGHGIAFVRAQQDEA
jgi:hypothetical protein